ncbi:MAG: hypothetical protein U0165_15950, partial [Polyangiaceae bacterium]
MSPPRPGAGMSAPGAPTAAMSEPGPSGASGAGRRATSVSPPTLRAPGADEPLPSLEDRIVMPESRFEVIDGQLIECAP